MEQVSPFNAAFKEEVKIEDAKFCLLQNRKEIRGAMVQHE